MDRSASEGGWCSGLHPQSSQSGNHSHQKRSPGEESCQGLSQVRTACFSFPLASVQHGYKLAHKPTLSCADLSCNPNNNLYWPSARTNETSLQSVIQGIIWHFRHSADALWKHPQIIQTDQGGVISVKGSHQELFCGWKQSKCDWIKPQDYTVEKMSWRPPQLALIANSNFDRDRPTLGQANYRIQYSVCLRLSVSLGGFFLCPITDKMNAASSLTVYCWWSFLGVHLFLTAICFYLFQHGIKST